ncbi:MAG: MCE family protein [Bacteroidales bacterium]|nr:MCE family protein [Bacteroidales bacterium]
MDKKSVVKIGVLAILALVLLVWGLSFLKGENLFKTQDRYVAVYNKLDGLAESNPVLLSGYRIGSVEKIDFQELNNSLKIIVRVKVNSDFNMPKGTVLKIVSVDIMGTKGIEVIRPEKFDGYHKSGDTLESMIQGGIIEQVMDMILPVKDDLAGFISVTDSVLHSLNALLTEKNVKNLTSGIENLQVLSEHLASNLSRIDGMISDFNNLSRTLAKNSGNIDRAIGNFAALSDTLNALNLAQTLSEAQTALNNINTALEVVNRGDGTVQKLLTSDSVYNNLEQLTLKANRLLEDFEKHPRKYVNLAIFGGKDKSSDKKK